MWEQINTNYLIIGNQYKVMNGNRFIVNAIYDGSDFKNAVTKEQIKGIVRVWM